MPLSEKHCQACGPGTPPLDEAALAPLLAQVPAWQRAEGGAVLQRDFTFDSYWAGLGFVNAVAWIAQQEKHHPDMELGYKKARVRFTTHAAQGLTENDFIGAAKVDRLLG
jgi:4a-hydroxytetrahydrobiopterin dehydratase